MRLIQHSLLCITVLVGVSFTAAESGSTEEFEAKKARADSLEQEADSLDRKALQLENQLDAIEENRSDLQEEIKVQIENLRETIDNIEERVEDAVNDLKDAQEEAEGQLEDRMEKREEHKHAGSFIFGIEYSHLDAAPLKYLAKHDKSLMDKYPFDFADNNMLMFGFMGYYNMDNNVRVGNGLYAGYKSFQSDPYSTVSVDSILNISENVDSVVTLRVIPAYIGFICEKAFIFDPVNFFAGIMLGGNLTVIVKEEQRSELTSTFISDDYDDERDSRYSVALAPAIAWDIHGGMAFKLAPRMHIGIDGVVRFAYAYEGYGAGFGDFLSVNPGVRLRLTFGNAG